MSEIQPIITSCEPQYAVRLKTHDKAETQHDPKKCMTQNLSQSLTKKLFPLCFVSSVVMWALFVDVLVNL